MRRSILNTIVVSLLAAAVAGCAKDVIPTGPMPNASLDGRIEIGPKLEPDNNDPNAYVTLVAGMHFTCAKRNDKAVFCWGLNDRSQIGFGSRTKCVSGLLCVATPTLISAVYDTLKATQLEAGAAHACILDEHSAAWCWGDGDQGQTGTGQYGWRDEPLAVIGGLTFTSIGAGGSSTCGTTTSGMFCWGTMSIGVLSTTLAPAPFPALVSKYAGYSSVAVGLSHACGLRFAGSGRFVDCWGSNGSGQLAIDPRTTTAAFTAQSKFGSAVYDVATEVDFTCAVQVSEIVQCTGLNNFGQLGNGQFATGPTGTPQTVGKGQLLHGVTTGYNHACALDNKNAAWCWGNGDVGQLGNGVRGVFNTPQAVVGGGTYIAIAAGKLHTCAIGTDRLLYCWGNNTSGELGVGLSDTLKATIPMRVVAPRS